MITPHLQHNKMRALRQYSQKKTQARNKKPAESVGKDSDGLQDLLSLRTPAVVSQQLTSYRSRVEDIKQEIHKLRTESPQLSLIPSPSSLRSKSFFISYPRSKKGEELLGSFIQMVNKRNIRPY